jgi:hypothetical protein
MEAKILTMPISTKVGLQKDSMHEALRHKNTGA